MTTEHKPHSERIAQQFHEVYERLAPEYAYETREESRVAWIDVPPKNRELMIATVEEVMGGFFEQFEALQDRAEEARLAMAAAGVRPDLQDDLWKFRKYYPEEAYSVPLEVEDITQSTSAEMDVLNYAWTIICNVSEGDWTKQSQEWQDAAARFRDQYHALLASNPAKRPS